MSRTKEKYNHRIIFKNETNIVLVPDIIARSHEYYYINMPEKTNK